MCTIREAVRCYEYGMIIILTMGKDYSMGMLSAKIGTGLQSTFLLFTRFLYNFSAYGSRDNDSEQ